MDTSLLTTRSLYQPPKLEQHHYHLITGISLPIGASGLDNPLELDFMEGEQ